jgi:16S rRNA (cytosine967-C5)-methyltransferase
MKLVEGKYQQNSSAIFPWQHELSNGIDKSDFTLSHLSQPCVFIRARPGKEPSVKAKLEKAAIPFSQVSDTCFAFNNNVQLETILELNKEYVVQDYNSQRVGEFMHTINENNLPLKVWDCCAASGGKAIMAYDILHNLSMTASDVRPSIIHNLKARFAEAGLKNYSSFIADLTQPQSSIPDAPFDLVICDAPCSGSGTWSRTPEQLYYFHNDEIWRYSGVQKQIVSNVIRFIKPGGYLLYVTCSVFKKENEDVIDFIQKDFQCKLIKVELLKGYDKKADTMFAALFRL